MWTPELETAWTPLAAKTGLSPLEFVEALVGKLMKNGKPLDSLIEGLSDGTLLAAMTSGIERRPARSPTSETSARHRGRP